MGDTDLDLAVKGDFDRFCGISSFLTGSVARGNGVFGISKPFGNPAAAAAKFDDKPARLARLDGNPPDKLVVRLEGIPPGRPRGKHVGSDGVGSPGLEVGGIGKLPDQPGIPDGGLAPDNGGIPPLKSCAAPAVA